MFDATLANHLGVPGSMCVHSATCGTALALEHNGDVYACDHFVDPAHLLGNIGDQPLVELVASEQQRAFGRAKREGLPEDCRACPVRFACHGGCPKDRFDLASSGLPELNHLCAGYLRFFQHVDPPMRFMAAALRRGGFADEVMGWMDSRDRRGRRPASGPGAGEVGRPR
jgi:uncharacterized protein